MNLTQCVAGEGTWEGRTGKGGGGAVTDRAWAQWLQGPLNGVKGPFMASRAP
jgi:hypothetical protein